MNTYLVDKALEYALVGMGYSVRGAKYNLATRVVLIHQYKAYVDLAMDTYTVDFPSEFIYIKSLGALGQLLALEEMSNSEALNHLIDELYSLGEIEYFLLHAKLNQCQLHPDNYLQ